MNGGQTSAPGIAIDVKGLTKSFGGREVVHDLSMQVKRGSIYGFGTQFGIFKKLWETR